MPYPLLTQYLSAIQSAENFKELVPISPVLENGRPKFASGAFAVVFKMLKANEGKSYALKCFTSEQAQRQSRYQKIAAYLQSNPAPFLVNFRYLPEELWVNLSQSEGAEYPVLLMPWIEGQTLGERLRQLCEQGDKAGIKALLMQFIDFALKLLALPCAHGDLKHDNLILGKDGQFYLVDYDGMFVPEARGEQALELGSHDYQHPSRQAKDYDEHLDDFSIGIIALSLALLAEEPSLLARYNNGQNLIFTRADFGNLRNAPPCRGLSLSSAQEALARALEGAKGHRVQGLSELLDKLSLACFNVLAWWKQLDLEGKTRIIAGAYTKPQLPPDFVWVEGGSFMMGCDPSRDGKGDGNEKPLHRVSLNAFAISRYALTYGEFRAFMQATNYQCQAKGASDKHPVVEVSWYDAVHYCNWRSQQEGLEAVYQMNGRNVTWKPSARGYRLPTEAEWEYAARGGQQSRGYRYAGSNAIEEVAWYEDNSGGRAQPVGQKKPNELGLYDMSGNVWEWCWGRYDGQYYAAANNGDNPTGPGAGWRLVPRGGSWNNRPESCRLAYRLIINLVIRYSYYGFRLVRLAP